MNLNSAYSCILGSSLVDDQVGWGEFMIMNMDLLVDIAVSLCNSSVSQLRVVNISLALDSHLNQSLHTRLVMITHCDIVWNQDILSLL